MTAFDVRTPRFQKNIEFVRLIAFVVTREAEAHALETLARAWAADAVPGYRIEQGAVGGALQVMAVRRQERTRTPVEFGAAVWAAIKEHGERPLPAQVQSGCFPRGLSAGTRPLGSSQARLGRPGSVAGSWHWDFRAEGFAGFVCIKARCRGGIPHSPSGIYPATRLLRK